MGPPAGTRHARHPTQVTRPTRNGSSEADLTQMDDISLTRKESMLESKWKFPVSPISAELSQRVGVRRDRAGQTSSCSYLLGLGHRISCKTACSAPHLNWLVTFLLASVSQLPFSFVTEDAISSQHPAYGVQTCHEVSQLDFNGTWTSLSFTCWKCPGLSLTCEIISVGNLGMSSQDGLTG
ncbi:hypothetical protein AV530_001674 [Patagioenas fasciata monilis]|uniref:Uncharacterized protein n=1 Tax=Patagioenas fasciata monilis TaxID=372326 RepID=A0A1V4KM09_PATFA|nr:hypothetical protein AV530_001674 [Patagioenas fasciata monilis]